MKVSQREINVLEFLTYRQSVDRNMSLNLTLMTSCVAILTLFGIHHTQCFFSIAMLVL